MFLIDCDDQFLLDHLVALASQKNLRLTPKKSNNYFSKLFVKTTNSNIEIVHNEKKYKISKPFKIDKFFTTITELLSKFNYKFENSFYFPLQQVFEYKNKSVRLGKIHHDILSSLFLNNQNGVNKFELYKFIWPQDKDVSINKLETHITNLKNQLQLKVAFRINISSNSGQLKLI